MKILTIVKDDRIIGIEYGIIEVPDEQIHTPHKQQIAKQHISSNVRNTIKRFKSRQNQK